LFPRASSSNIDVQEICCLASASFCPLKVNNVALLMSSVAVFHEQVCAECCPRVVLALLPTSYWLLLSVVCVKEGECVCGWVRRK
jgi:hypothetical protein